MKKQEPEQASKCPEVGEYPKNGNNVYLNEATIVTSRRKNIKVLVYSTDFLTESEYFQVRVRVLFEIKSFENEYSKKLYSSTSTVLEYSTRVQYEYITSTLRVQYSSTPSLTASSGMNVDLVPFLQAVITNN